MKLSVEIPWRDSEEIKKTFKEEFEKSCGGLYTAGTMTIGKCVFNLRFTPKFSMTQLHNGTEMSFEIEALSDRTSKARHGTFYDKGEAMKRYKGLTMSVPRSGEGEPESIIVSAAMNEDAGGEWVRWEDHRRDFFRWTEVYEERIRELKEQVNPECNCKEMYESTRFANMDGTASSWFCPVHGYKKR